MTFRIEYNMDAEPITARLGFIGAAPIEDEVVQIDCSELTWEMYSDESHENLRDALTSIEGISGVNVFNRGEYV